MQTLFVAAVGISVLSEGETVGSTGVGIFVVACVIGVVGFPEIGCISWKGKDYLCFCRG